MVNGLRVIGDKVVNKRLSNMQRYIVQVTGKPSQYLVSQTAVNASVGQARKSYATPKNKPRYPLRWKSDKQRIAVIIKLKKEGNLPYRRTGNLDRAWSATVKPNVIEIANTAQSDGVFYAPFTIGAFQQPFHADTGFTKRTIAIEKQIIKPITDDLMRQAKRGIEASKNA